MRPHSSLVRQRHPACQRLLSIALLLALLITSLVAAPQSAQAHGAQSAVVPRMGFGQPAPLVDGDCRVEEYTGTVNLTHPILYRPHYNWNPAHMRLIATAGDLYICVQNLPLHAGSTEPYVSVAFDVNHNGGTVPAADDLLFSLTETGALSAARGDGGGSFSPDPALSGWHAARRPNSDEVTWNAEFRLPLTLIGGGAPLTTIGFHLRHNWLRFGGDDYAWPYNGGWNVPNTWGDLTWLGAPATTEPPRLDVARISQGLAYDSYSVAAYELVANKDTLARAQVYTFNPLRTVTAARCIVQRISRLDSGRWVPEVGAAQIFLAEGSPYAAINPAPYGFFNGTPVFNCWTGAALLTTAGDYRFQLEIELHGATPVRLDLGTRRFLPTADLRLLLTRFRGGATHPNTIDWSDSLSASLAEAMREFNRRYPLRSEVGSLNTVGLWGHDPQPGLRYLLHPIFGACETAAGESDTACDTRARNFSELVRRNFNAHQARLDAADGRLRDRLDWGMLLYASSEPLGGQSCWFDHGHRVAGGTADPHAAGGTATIAVHEISHCMGLGHSAPWEIFGESVANTRTYLDMPGPVALMNGFVANVYHTWFLAPEWNWLRQQLLTMERPRLTAAGAAASHEPAASQPLFRLVGSIDRNGGVTITSAGRVDDLPLELTPENPQGSYALVFSDASGAELARHPFVLTFDDPDAGQRDLAGLLLITPLPTGSAGVALVLGPQTLYAQTFSPNAPAVTDVTVNSDGKQMTLSWKGDDVDKQPDGGLTYDVSFSPSDNQPPLLLAAGLRETSYTFPLALMPATQSGTLHVEASDGYNTGQAASVPFAIGPQSPLVRITIPVPQEPFLEAQPLPLIGQGYDPAAGAYGGPLPGAALSWHSDRDGDLGTGERLPAQLSPGSHTLTLTAHSSSGLSASTSLEINVQPDADRDGLADSYETQHACLSPAALDSDADSDGDGLAALAEAQHGSNPCAADTDVDGAGDGDEVQAGSNPLDPQAQPAHAPLFVSADELNLGACPQVGATSVTVQLPPSVAEWRAFTAAPWLRVSGGSNADGVLTVSGDCTDLGVGFYRDDVLIGTSGGTMHLLSVQMEVSDQPPAQSINLFLPLITR